MPSFAVYVLCFYSFLSSFYPCWCSELVLFVFMSVIFFEVSKSRRWWLPAVTQVDKNHAIPCLSHAQLWICAASRVAVEREGNTIGDGASVEACW